jgi:tetratricopeptide (TPR) repeat protein
MKGYSTSEVSDLVNLPQEVIREFARTGLLDSEHQKSKHYRFSFQDIIILRTAKELNESGVNKSRLSKVLLKLKEDLPSGRSLTSFSIRVEGGNVLIRDNAELYNPETGQVLFDFTISDLAGEVAILSRKAFHEAEVSDHVVCSDDWFDLGVDLEAVSPADAPAAYLKAIEMDPQHSDAYTNLGRLAQEAQEYEAAERYYRSAITAEPQNVLAAFNLGTLMEDVGNTDAAIEAYTAAASFADSHHNLARLYELQGNHLMAERHLQTYKKMLDA